MLLLAIIINCLFVASQLKLSDLYCMHMHIKVCHLCAGWRGVVACFVELKCDNIPSALWPQHTCHRWTHKIPI